MDFEECTLISVVNPGQYLVLSQEEEHIREIQQLEELLTNEIECGRAKKCNNFFIEQSVAIKLSKSNTAFKRGVIKKKISDELFEVFLIDNGITVSVMKSDIFINSNQIFYNVEPKSFFITLHGLLPVKACRINGFIKQKVCEEWSDASQDFVNNVLQRHTKDILVSSILLYKNMVYGDIIFKDKKVSLRNLLINHKFCVYSEKYFLIKVFKSNDTDAFHNTANSQHQIEFYKAKQKETKHISEQLVELNDAKEIKAMFPFKSSQTLCKASSFCEKKEGRGILKEDQPLEVYIGRGKSVKLKSSVGNWNEKTSLKTNSSWSSSSCIFSSEVSSDVKTSKGHDSSSEFNKLDSSTDETLDIVLDTGDSTNIINLDEIFLSNNPIFRSKSPTSDFSPVDDKKKGFSDDKKLKSFDDEQIKMSNVSNKNTPQFNEYSKPFILFGNSDSVVEPLKKFSDLIIESDIIQNLNKCGRFDELSTLQSWTIPSIQNQHDVVMIGSPKTGKTLSYIIPTIDFVKKKCLGELSYGNGPLVLILCSSSRVGEFIYTVCNSLLGHFRKESKPFFKVSVVLAIGGSDEKNVWTDLTNGCHILIATPHCLVRLVEVPLLTNFERLSCLILDEFNIISQEPFKNNVQVILKKVKYNTKSRGCQKIFCGERWTPDVERLINLYLESYTLVIGSYSEAAICARLKPNIYLVDQKHKAKILLDKIRDAIGKKKILIICEDSSDAISAKMYLMNNGVECFVFHEKLTAENCKEIRLMWSTRLHIVVIATDDVIGELQIHDAEILIHYSLPRHSKTNFFLRYSAIFEKILSRCSSVQDLRKSIREADVILVDDENQCQLPQIVDFVERLGGNISNRVKEKCSEIVRLRETSKDAPVCTGLLTLGHCRNYKTCSRRHALVKTLDSPSHHPSNGWVTFSVLKVHDASSFSVTLLEHFEPDGNRSKIHHPQDLPEKLKAYYDCQSNRRVIAAPRLGSLCGIKSYALNKELYQRAEIVEIITYDKFKQPATVIVQLIDEGGFTEAKATTLYELPDDLAKLPRLAIDVILVGVQPLDCDISWSQSASNFSKNLLTRKLEENQYWIGKIVLALRNLLLMEPVMLKQFFPNFRAHICNFVVQKRLIANRIAVANDEHFFRLLEIFKKGGIDIPKDNTNKKSFIQQPQWAFFDKDVELVTFSSAENTSRIFLQRKKFRKLLMELENLCQHEANDSAQSVSKKCELSIGMFCLALSGNRWNRGRIESEKENKFYIYFVDHGDFEFVDKENVKSISQNLLLRLPCQAIECSLVGVKALEECSSEIIDEIYNFSGDGLNDLYVCIVDKNLKADVTGGRKYSLNLLNSKGKSINKLIVEKGLVEAVESEKSLIKDIPIELLKDKDEFTEDKGSDEENSDVNSLKGKKSYRNSNGEVNLEKYFSQMSDDLFENENEKLFLEMFATKFLPSFEANGSAIKEKENIERNRHKSNNINLNEELKSDEAKTNQPSAGSLPTAPKINYARLMKLYKAVYSKKDEKVELKVRDGILTPKVLWHQTHSDIRLKILLTNVEKYECNITATNLLFRCILNGNMYAVDVKFFGAIHPNMTVVSLKTFHVVINLKKLCFPLWPRLLRDEGKIHWIGADVDSMEDDEDSVSKSIILAQQNIEAKILKEGIRSEILYPYSESDNTDLDDEFDSSDDEEF